MARVGANLPIGVGYLSACKGRRLSSTGHPARQSVKGGLQTLSDVMVRQPAVPFPDETFGRELKRPHEQVELGLFIVLPFVALIAAIPFAWGWGLSWHDVVIAVVMYAIAGHGVTIGFHRCFTHKAFKARRWFRVLLAVAGSMAIQGPVIRWVADHRKHHRYSDKEGDPHSPWRYGTGARDVMKGMFFAHLGWLFAAEQTSQKQYAPDLIEDRDLVRVSKTFPLWVALSMLIPPLVGGLWSWSWEGALTAFFWGSLVRVALLHHVTFSINSICHVTGRRPFRTRDRSGNVWWLAILSMGESWHNWHHADPTSARHGVLRGQVDTSARLIWLFERCHWVYAVKWRPADQLAMRRVAST